MELILIRHGQAGDAGTWLAQGGVDDDQRPLTEEGSKRLRRAFRGLRRVLQTPDWVGVSPLTRAQQTAELMREAYLDLPLHTTPHLRPEDEPHSTLDWLHTHHPVNEAQDKRIALVGHEPHLSRLLALLAFGDCDLPGLPLKKGGVALLHLASWQPGTATLQALLPPKVLRALG